MEIATLLQELWHWLLGFIISTGAVVFAIQRILAGKEAVKESIRKEFELGEWRKDVEKKLELVDELDKRVLNVEQTPDLQQMILEQIKEMDRRNSEDHQANKDAIDKLATRIDGLYDLLLEKQK